MSLKIITFGEQVNFLKIQRVLEEIGPSFIHEITRGVYIVDHPLRAADLLEEIEAALGDEYCHASVFGLSADMSIGCDIEGVSTDHPEALCARGRLPCKAARVIEELMYPMCSNKRKIKIC